MGQLLASAAVTAFLLVGSSLGHAQSVSDNEFEAVSIKRNTSGVGGGGRVLPDGTSIVTNAPISSFILRSSAIPVTEVIGLPDWAETERYDVIAKPRGGTTREQRQPMWHAMFAERMKLVAHVENREREAFALVLAETEERVMARLRPSSADCQQIAAARNRDSGSPVGTPSCGMMTTADSIIAGSVTMGQLAAALGGFVGRDVNDRTGLQGKYDFNLRFTDPTSNGPADLTAPSLVSALRELGLRLQPEKALVPVLVVDHIERPTEN